MYNLTEYRKNYKKSTGSLWYYYRHEAIEPIRDSESFKHKTTVLGKRASNGHTKEVEFAVQLKYLNSFCRTLEMPMIIREVNLILKWSENCVLTDTTTQDAVPAQGNNPERSAINISSGATFKIIDAKLCVPFVILLAQDNNKLLQQLKAGFKRNIKRNKYRSEMTNQTESNNLNYLIDPTFNKVNRFFVLSFENEHDKKSFLRCYTPNVEIRLQQAD